MTHSYDGYPSDLGQAPPWDYPINPPKSSKMGEITRKSEVLKQFWVEYKQSELNNKRKTYFYTYLLESNRSLVNLLVGNYHILNTKTQEMSTNIV